MNKLQTQFKNYPKQGGGGEYRYYSTISYYIGNRVFCNLTLQNQTDPFTFVPVATARVSEPTHIVQPGGAEVQNSNVKADSLSTYNHAWGCPQQSN